MAESRMRGYPLGFTLIEILVVVLIIGILGAIALPQYQRAVLKSRFAALMPIAKSMADSNEAYFLEHGEYAGNAEDLPIQGRRNYSDGTSLEFGTTSEYSYVLATRGNDFPNHYIVYQKHSGKFPDNIHCEADEHNDMAKEVCLSLGGQKIDGSLKDGFVTYVLSGMRGALDTFPTSISKLKAQICEGFSPENCIVDDKNNTITTQECTGTLTSTSGSRTCINRTYNDTGEQVDYERVQTSCSSFSNAAYSNASKCYTYVYDEQDQTSSTEDLCDLNQATWANGECTWSSGAGYQYYIRTVTEGTNTKYWSYTCINVDCTQSQRVYVEGESGTSITSNRVRYARADQIDTRANYTYWKDYSQNLKTTVAQPQRGGDVTFTTTNTQTNEVVGTVTCAFADADWDTGTCKPGTAIGS